MHQKKKKSIGTGLFYCIFLLLVIASLVAIIVFLKQMEKRLVEYEGSQPSARAPQIFEVLFRDPDWEQLYNSAQSTPDIPVKDYAAYMTDTVGDARLHYSPLPSSSHAAKSYGVYNNTEKIATFTIRNTRPQREEPDWQLAGVELYCNANYSVRVQASPDHKVIVNGVTLGEDHLQRSVTTRAEAYLPEGLHGYRMNEYFIDGLLREPEVEVLDENGAAVEMTFDNANNLYCPVMSTQNATQEQTQAILDAAEAYCKYMVGDIGKFVLRKHFDVQSPIYEAITSAELWMEDYEEHKLGQATITDFYGYSQEYCGAHVTMTVTVTGEDGVEKEFPLDSTFLMKKGEDGGLMVADMVGGNLCEPMTQVRLTYIASGDVVQSDLLDATTSRLMPPTVTGRPGTTFQGWYTRHTSKGGATVMEPAFLPGEDGMVYLPEGYVLEPMTLYAVFE